MTSLCVIALHSTCSFCRLNFDSQCDFRSMVFISDITETDLGKVWSDYNMVTFIKDTHRRHSISPHKGKLLYTTNLFGGILVALRTSVCPSVRPASCVCSVAPTVLVWSISYLCILLSNLRRCVTCKVSCSILKFEFLQFLKFVTLTLFCFDFGIWCESLVGVIMGWRGYLRTQAF